MDDLWHILNHLGEPREQYRGAVAPPIFQTSIFASPDVASMREALRDELSNSFYTRGNNPTVETLRRKLAALEGAEDALVFSSGAGAVAAAVIACVGAGSHVLCVSKPYSWTRSLLVRMLPGFGVETTFVDGGDAADFEAQWRHNTKLVVLESPNSLTFEMQDLAAIATLAKARDALTLIDNSYASPLLQQPIRHGIDLVVHSATKYLNGHSDVVAGAVCGSSALIRRIFQGPFMTLGAVPSAHDAALLLRGLRTLPVRMQRIEVTTLEVITFLAAHPSVLELYYPGSADAQQASLAARYLSGLSGMLSLRVRGGRAAAERFANALQRFLLACSWGGYESLAFPLCAIPAQIQLPDDLVRLSIGLEDASVLIADLDQALAASAA